MTVRITSKDTEESIKKKLEAHSSKKKFDAQKYFGKIKLKVLYSMVNNLFKISIR